MPSICENAISLKHNKTKYACTEFLGVKFDLMLINSDLITEQKALVE